VIVVLLAPVREGDEVRARQGAGDWFVTHVEPSTGPIPATCGGAIESRRRTSGRCSRRLPSWAWRSTSSRRRKVAITSMRWTRNGGRATRPAWSSSSQRNARSRQRGGFSRHV
jgi:hypothetical protein